MNNLIKRIFQAAIHFLCTHCAHVYVRLHLIDITKELALLPTKQCLFPFQLHTVKYSPHLQLQFDAFLSERILFTFYEIKQIFQSTQIGYSTKFSNNNNNFYFKRQRESKKISREKGEKILRIQMRSHKLIVIY